MEKNLEELFQQACLCEDIEKAMNQMCEIADLGHTEAALWLGNKYGYRGAFKKAFEYYLKAALNGNDEAIYYVGTNSCYYNMFERFKYTKEQMQTLAKLEQNDNLYLGWIRGCQRGFVGDSFEDAMTWYNNKIKNNEEVMTLSFMKGYYYRKVGVYYEVNLNEPKLAVEYYKKSVEFNSGLGQYNLARCYADAIGIEKDLDKAIELYILSIEQGNDWCLNNLGCVYHEKKEYKKAYETWVKGLQSPKHSAYLYINIAELYEEGQYFEQDNEKAMEYFSRAYLTDRQSNLVKEKIGKFAKKIGKNAKDIFKKLDAEFKANQAEKLDKIVTEFKEFTSIPAIKIKPERKDGILITDSKFGGNPYLPQGFIYPTDDNGRPLKLLAQINFEQVPHLEHFPKKGILQFYLGDEEMYGLYDGGNKVVYHNTIEENPQTEFPKIEDEDGLYLPFEGEFALSFEETTSHMTTADENFNSTFLKIYQKYINLDDNIDSVYDLDEEDYDYIFQNILDSQHLISGHPYFVQDDVRDEKDNVMLLQIDSEDNICWGDAGVGNFFINLEKLKELDFSDVLYNWDCS